MDYNELKLRVLTLLKGSGELPSEVIRAQLRELRVDVRDKAVKMALMRYTRQGLLARSKKAGLFHYRITEKGVARRNWLSKTM